MTLTKDDGAHLLRLARAAIEDRLFGRGALAAARARIATSPALAEERGVFVTLKVPDPAATWRLRGCIGSIVGREPLHEGVVSAARAAAFDDPRFAPLTAEEYGSVRVSVSALTPLERVPDASAIVVGEHGVLLEAAGGKAVFLPQVAVEQRWSVRELLEHLGRKAGLSADAWRAAALSVFRSENFGENGTSC